MTTIVGIKTNVDNGLEGVIFGSDRQLGFEHEGKLVSKKSVSNKIVYGRDWMMGSAGSSHFEEVHRFYQILKGDRRYGSNPERANEIISKAIKNYDNYTRNPKKNDGLHFEEISQLNARIMRSEESESDTDNLYKFLLAVNTKEGMRFFRVDELGNLEEPEAKRDDGFDYVCIGSGEDKVDSYIDDYLDSVDIDRVLIDIPMAIELATGSIHRAEVDAYTMGPIDLSVLTKEGISSFGKEIRDSLRDAEKKKIDEIKKRFSN